ncbi:hypothetical protein ACFXOY_28135 [Streptomyces niveus]|uniref:hypothetical protein n=1 Tax=Streptomyces niveus TaxID=193462 RepID=UPI0036C669BA
MFVLDHLVAASCGDVAQGGKFGGVGAEIPAEFGGGPVGGLLAVGFDELSGADAEADFATFFASTDNTPSTSCSPRT